MGSICKTQKEKRDEKYKSNQEEHQDNSKNPADQLKEDQKYNEPNSRIRKLEFKEKTFMKNRSLLELYLSFSKSIETLTINNSLPQNLQQTLLKLQLIKKNTDAIIQNSEKRSLRKQSSEQPQDLICRDVAFGNMLWIQVDKIQRLLELLIMDKSFEESYPDICKGFNQLNDQINDIEEKYKCKQFFTNIYSKVRLENASTNIAKFDEIK